MDSQYDPNTENLNGQNPENVNPAAAEQNIPVYRPPYTPYSAVTETNVPPQSEPQAAVPPQSEPQPTAAPVNAQPPRFEAPPQSQSNSYYYAQHPYAAPQPPERPKAKEKKNHTGIKVAAIALTCAILGSIGGGTLAAYLMRGSSNTASAQATEATSQTQEATTSKEFQSAISTNSSDNYMSPSQIYSTYVDAVVGITNEGTTTNVYGQSSATASSGSGFIITADGYVVTNYHVIESASTLTVTLHNGTSYDAKVVGYDSTNDVALLKIDATGLTAAPLGDSDSLNVGDEVAAIGNPLGELDFTMTVGYISALDRVINTDGTPINMLQTDAAINSGNSGGPLFDMHGNVVGITTAKYSGSTTTGTTIEGLGFAIPINDVKAIVSDLMKYGYVTGQPYIGIKVGDIDSSYMTYYNYPSSAYVASVESGSCGETAGLKQGDIITALGDTKIESYTDLAAALKNYAAGDSTTITVYRNGEETTLNITFDERKPSDDTDATTESTESTQQTDPGFGGFGNIFP